MPLSRNRQFPTFDCGAELLFLLSNSDEKRYSGVMSNRLNNHTRIKGQVALKCGLIVIFLDHLYLLAIGRELAARPVYELAPEKYWIVAIAIGGGLAAIAGAVTLYLIDRSRGRD